MNLWSRPQHWLSKYANRVAPVEVSQRGGNSSSEEDSESAPATGPDSDTYGPNPEDEDGMEELDSEPQSLAPGAEHRQDDVLDYHRKIWHSRGPSVMTAFRATVER